jgi:Ser-Thr-rich glycosyl-phosphatidyl-inositol-anchored membrane family
MKGLLSTAIVLAALGTSAQKATIKKVDLAGEKIIVYYDLEDSNASNEYLLNLYSSKDNFATALKNVEGDVGLEVKPGTNRRIEWNIRKEYGSFKGKISLEMRGKVYLPFVKLQNFDASKSYKRGNSYDVNWKPGNANPIHVELLKGNLRMQGDLNHPNNGSYLLSIPSKLKPGKDYRLRITDSKNSEEIIYTSYFRIKPKVPLALKVLPVLAIGGLAAVLLGGKKGGGGDTGSNPTEIPVPGLPGN